MASYTPVTRSKSRKLIPDVLDADQPERQYVPAPLTIRKSSAPARFPSVHSRQRSGNESIGLALGSPREEPLPRSQHHDMAQLQSFNFPAAPIPPTYVRSQTDAFLNTNKELKGRNSRWKTFGGLFSRRTVTIREDLEKSSPALSRPMHSSQPTHRATQSDAYPLSRKRAGSDKEKGMEAQHTSSTTTTAYAPLARAPSMLRRASTKKKGVRRRTPSQAAAAQRLAATPPRAAALTQNPPSARPSMDKPYAPLPIGNRLRLLQVDIPNVEMERYSVMFGDVLHPGSSNASARKMPLTALPAPIAQSAKGQRPSVSMLEESVRLGRPSGAHIRDRSSSSSRARSPSFSLFPTTHAANKNNKPLPRPSPLGRSVTSPDAVNPATLTRPPIKLHHSGQEVSRALIAAMNADKENIPISKYASNDLGTDSQGPSSALEATKARPQHPHRGHISQLSSGSSSARLGPAAIVTDAAKPPSRPDLTNHSNQSAIAAIVHQRTSSTGPPLVPFQPETASDVLSDTARPKTSTGIVSTDAIGNSDSWTTNITDSPGISDRPTLTVTTAFPRRKSSLKRSKLVSNPPPLPNLDAQIPFLVPWTSTSSTPGSGVTASSSNSATATITSFDDFNLPIQHPSICFPDEEDTNPTHLAKPQPSTPDSTNNSKPAQNDTQVNIARSISLSKRKQALVPISRNGTIGSGSGLEKGASAGKVVKHGIKTAEMIVIVDAEDLMMSRKSRVAVLEEA